MTTYKTLPILQNEGMAQNLHCPLFLNRNSKVFINGSMTKLDKIVEDLESVLDSLIANAEQMNLAAKKVISKDELKMLQDTQQDLIKQLIDIDDKYQKAKKRSKLAKEPSAMKRVNEKLHYFEQLNANFIHHVNLSFDLIHFDSRKKKF